ncbi:MAG: M16 family metallopeptidase [Myxococcota bacterium]
MKRAVKPGLLALVLSTAFLASCQHAPATQAGAPKRSAPVISFPDREQRPPPLSGTAFQLPTIVDRRLSNGIRVLIVQQRDAPIVCLRLLVKRGAADVAPGVAQLAVATFFRRVKSVPGASAQVWAGYDALSIQAAAVTRWSQSSNLPDDTFSALARMLHVVDLPDDAVEAARRELLERTTDLEHDLDATAARLAHSLLYPLQHPYHFDVHGEKPSVASVSRATLEQFFREHVQPDQLTMVAVGDIAIESFISSMKFNFGSWQGNAVPRRALPEPISAPPSGPAISLLNAPSLGEAAITVGARGVAWNSPDFHALVLLNTLLGGSFQSRLNMNLRERMAYAYSPFSTFGIWRGTGPFLVHGKVDADDTADAITRIAGELTRVRNEPLSDTELRELKRAATRRIPLLFATLADTVAAVSQLAVHDQPINTYALLAERIQQVTPEDLQRVARAYLAPEQLRWIVIAPAKRVKESLERLPLGAVTQVDSL